MKWMSATIVLLLAVGMAYGVALVVGQPWVGLWWTQPSGTPVSWNIYKGTAPGVCNWNGLTPPSPFANVTTLPTQSAPWVDTSVTRGSSYIYAVSAVYSGGGESNCTSELQLTVSGSSQAPGVPQGSTH